ncbi:MAG: hypothetical protein DRJ47_10100 [Thermoprotei archaeon]|nr:MAG: hypothetical protein DRJ47_10100 [Thermoprotei archaeon]
MITALNKVVYTVTAGSPKLSDLRAAGIQVYMKTPKMFWVTKPVIIRNVPITAVRPTPRLAEWRYIFAETAKEWKGAKGVGTLKQDSRSKKHKAGDTVLKVHEIAQEKLKAAAKKLTKPRAATYDAEAKVYRSYIRYRIHTPEELKKIAGI